FFYSSRTPPALPPFPTRRSSDLLPVTADPDVSFPAVYVGVGQPGAAPQELEAQVMQKIEGAVAGIGNIDSITSWAVEGQANMMVDRKSTRLNSSHGSISYAVFCL